jgi:methionyl-tRNA synthetase
MPFGNDALFTHELFVNKFNVLLANDLGNLVSRTISMINKYFNGNVSKANIGNDFDADLENVIKNSVATYMEAFDNFKFQIGLNAAWDIISRGNKYIDETTPWVLAKDESKEEELKNVMYHLFEVLRIVAILITPVMPDTAKVIFEELGLSNISFKDLNFGETKASKVIEKPIVLFKRLDWKEEEKNAL